MSLTSIADALRNAGYTSSDGTFVYAPTAKVVEVVGAEIERLSAALRPFAEVPPQSPPTLRCIVMAARAGVGFHFYQSDLDRAKEVYRSHQQQSPSLPQTPKEG